VPRIAKYNLTVETVKHTASSCDQVEFLLEKGYIVHGIKRRASSYNHLRLEHILQPGPFPQAVHWHDWRSM
jgi:hypothetical protein